MRYTRRRKFWRGDTAETPVEGSGCKGCSIRNIVKQMKEEAEK